MPHHSGNVLCSNRQPLCVNILLFSSFHLLHSYFTAVSGTSMYESWVYSVYNFALGLPIIFYGIFDRDIPQAFSLKYPQVGTVLVAYVLAALVVCLYYAV